MTVNEALAIADANADIANCTAIAKAVTQLAAEVRRLRYELALHESPDPHDDPATTEAAAGTQDKERSEG